VLIAGRGPSETSTKSRRRTPASVRRHFPVVDRRPRSPTRVARGVAGSRRGAGREPRTVAEAALEVQRRGARGRCFVSADREVAMRFAEADDQNSPSRCSSTRAERPISSNVQKRIVVVRLARPEGRSSLRVMPKSPERLD